MRDIQRFNAARNHLLLAAKSSYVDARCMLVLGAANDMLELESEFHTLQILLASARRCLWIYNAINFHDVEATVLLAGSVSETEMNILNRNLPQMIELAIREMDEWARVHLYTIPGHILLLTDQLHGKSPWLIIEEALKVVIEMDADDYAFQLNEYEQNHSAGVND